MNFDWPDKSVLVSRISSFSGPDGYDIEVLGDSGLTKFFTFTHGFDPNPAATGL